MTQVERVGSYHSPSYQVDRPGQTGKRRGTAVQRAMQFSRIVRQLLGFYSISQKPTKVLREPRRHSIADQPCREVQILFRIKGIVVRECLENGRFTRADGPVLFYVEVRKSTI